MKNIILKMRKSTARFRPVMGVLQRSVLIFMLACGAHGQAGAPDRQLATGYSPLKEIHRDNVHQLQLAWEYRTGDIPTGQGVTSFQDQPLLVEGSLVVCSPSRKLIALDPATGAERWVFDPGSTGRPDKCRGAGVWVDEAAAKDQACRTRLLLGTKDYRLLAVDARTGKLCEDFGDRGVVHMEPSKPLLFPGEVEALSRPAVVNGVVVVGSSVIDNQRVDAPSGRVLAYDARTGEFRWKFDPIPQAPTDPAWQTWHDGSALRHGAGNVWSGMSVDEARDLVFLPTTSPSLDFYGGSRPGDNLYTNSVVALRGSTGEVVWYFQIVRHDVWDYDLNSPGMLIDYPHNGERVPALVQNTKQGMIFIFNRETGEPLVPIEDRPVPQEGATPGEWLSPTQPFPVGMPPVARQSFSPDDVWGFTPFDRRWCRRRAEKLLYGPIYTPPSLQGTVSMPSQSGGPSWGGGGYDPDSHIMVVPSNLVPMIVTNTPREEDDIKRRTELDVMGPLTFDNLGIPHVTTVEPFLSPLGAPCVRPPWAVLTAVDIVNKEILWEVPLGSIDKLAPLPIPWRLGTPGAGGPLVTAGGVVFIGYTLDHRFRAFDLKTGETLWTARLPASATSIPVTYQWEGEQFVVVAAGGHSMYGTELSDAVMAFKLPR